MRTISRVVFQAKLSTKVKNDYISKINLLSEQKYIDYFALQ